METENKNTIKPEIAQETNSTSDGHKIPHEYNIKLFIDGAGSKAVPFASSGLLAQGGCGQPRAHSHFTSGCYGVILRILYCVHRIINNPGDMLLLWTITA